MPLPIFLKLFTFLLLFPGVALPVSSEIQATPPQDNFVYQVDPEQKKSLLDRTLRNMIFVQGGSFMMGDPGEKLISAFGDKAFYYYLPCRDNQPAHLVTLDPYYMSKYEVTFEDHDIFSAATKREPTEASDLGQPWRAADTPAFAHWHSAKDYCEWLGEQTCLPFALPTEAQWEYAARSRGKVVPFATDTGLIERGVNYPEFSRWPLPVGQFPPNPLGFHDMSGNASEWVSDFYDPEYYSRSPEHNPQGPETGTTKVFRGGSVYSSPGGSSVVLRGEGRYTEDYSRTGFRCVINTDKPLPMIGEEPEAN